MNHLFSEELDLMKTLLEEKGYDEVRNYKITFHEDAIELEYGANDAHAPEDKWQGYRYTYLRGDTTTIEEEIRKWIALVPPRAEREQRALAGIVATAKEFSDVCVSAEARAAGIVFAEELNKLRAALPAPEQKV